jgi:hypothetical protein
MAPVKETGPYVPGEERSRDGGDAARLFDLRQSASAREKEAARLLGIDQRNLGDYLRKHDIDPDRVTR